MTLKPTRAISIKPHLAPCWYHQTIWVRHLTAYANRQQCQHHELQQSAHTVNDGSHSLRMQIYHATLTTLHMNRQLRTIKMAKMIHMIQHRHPHSPPRNWTIGSTNYTHPTITKIKMNYYPILIQIQPPGQMPHTKINSCYEKQHGIPLSHNVLVNMAIPIHGNHWLPANEWLLYCKKLQNRYQLL